MLFESSESKKKRMLRREGKSRHGTTEREKGRQCRLIRLGTAKPQKKQKRKADEAPQLGDALLNARISQDSELGSDALQKQSKVQRSLMIFDEIWFLQNTRTKESL